MAKQGTSTLIVTPSASKTESSLASLLLVEDREPDLVITRIMLEDEARLKCNLLVARDGQEALAVLQREINEGRQIDLVLLDINMPRLDGFETLECMRQNDAMKHVEVVMCTGSIDDKDRNRAQSLGAIGYVLKPTLFAKLKPVLEQASDPPPINRSTSRVILHMFWILFKEVGYVEQKIYGGADHRVPAAG